MRTRKNTKSLSDPAGWVSNMLSSFPTSTSELIVALNLYKSDNTHLDHIMVGFTQATSDADMLEQLDTIVKTLTNETNPTATLMGTLVYHRNFSESLRLAETLRHIGDRHYLTTIGVIASNGAEWKDIIAGTSGEVDRTMLTDFQLYHLLHEDAIQPYEI